MSARLEAWLDGLRHSLALYPGRRADVVDEVRDHLLEARARLVDEGLGGDAAERLALERFGEPGTLARDLIAQRARARGRVVLPLALLFGAALAWIDGRPTWDDTGVSAAAVLAACALLGRLEPTRPWVWGLAVGAWFPLLAWLEHRSPAAALALVFACAGAWCGRLARRLATS